jgi:hypothetical protein
MNLVLFIDLSLGSHVGSIIFSAIASTPSLCKLGEICVADCLLLTSMDVGLS